MEAVSVPSSVEVSSASMNPNVHLAYENTRTGTNTHVL
jgi:hypothetical protein